MTWKRPFACVGFCAFTVLTLCSFPSDAQTPDVKEQPPMYSYVADWQIPRPHWADMQKSNAVDTPILEKALADGTIVGFGNDESLVHQQDGATHDNWWSAMSIAGLINVLNQFYASGNTTSDALTSATKHWDSIVVSRYYHWHSGPCMSCYTRVAFYKLKPGAPSDAVESLSKHLVAPLLESLLADGTIAEYEIDTEAIHTQDPGGFSIVYVATKPEGLDKVLAKLQESLKAQPLAGSAFGSMTDMQAHRDELLRSDLKYK